MQLRECIERVLTTYLTAAKDDLKEHPTAKFLRKDFRDAVASASGDHGRLIFKASAGQGRWVKGPWVGIFDQLVTTSAQSGYYPVYLFREDMQGVYLSLNQGMTEAKKNYKADAKTALRARAANFRAMLGAQINLFPDLVIDLAPTAPSNDTAFYEAGNICAKFYPINQLPPEAQLIGDLSSMLLLYQAILEGEVISDSNNASEGDEPVDLHYEDGTKFRFHKRIERNVRLSKDVKKLQGYVCKVCNTNFEKSMALLERGTLKPII